MQITLVMVASVDGRITRGDEVDVRSWSSKEDQENFSDLLDKAEVIVMGRKTYEVAKVGMQHKEGRLRVVMTRTPGKFMAEQRAGMLEFTDKKPGQIIDWLQGEGKRRVLVVGGGEIAAVFLQAKLITRLLLTIEPLVFGEGKSLFGDEVLGMALHLEKSQALNTQGTLLLEYTVTYES